MVTIIFFVNYSVYNIYAAINAVHKGEILERTMTSDDGIIFTAINQATVPIPPTIPLHYNLII